MLDIIIQVIYLMKIIQTLLIVINLDVVLEVAVSQRFAQMRVSLPSVYTSLIYSKSLYVIIILLEFVVRNF